jgi:hypothetical protein
VSGYHLLIAQQVAAGGPPTMALWLVQSGLVGGIAAVFGILHRSAERAKQEAVAAERRRADDWRVSAELANARADERDRQLWTVLSAVKDSAGTA